jgi:predicted nuclease of predicted toxin-antitoxin system
MKILIDNNLSFKVSKYLDALFAGTKHVADFGLDENTEDSLIWKFATDNHFSILTKDTDFEAMSRLLGCPPKVIQLTCGNKKTPEIISILGQNEMSLEAFLKDEENCLMFLQ